MIPQLPTAAAVLVLAPTAFASSASTEVSIREAVATYAAAMDSEDRSVRLETFRRTTRLFARAIEGGAHNAAIYTNLGNAALQSEQMGIAVLAYNRALLIDPDHPRALQNLDHARSLLPSWVPHPEENSVLDSFFFWHRTLSRDERSLAAAACFALAGALLALAVRSGSSTPRNIAILPALAWIALVASVLIDPASWATDAAVITADEVAARAADSAFAPSLFSAPLPGGTEVRILESRPPWARIRLANGRDVWVTESSIDPVLP